MKMSKVELRSRLLRGLDIDVDGIIVKNYKCGFIVDNIGLDCYYTLLNMSKFSKEDMLDKRKLDKEIWDNISIIDFYANANNDRLYKDFIGMLNVFILHDIDGFIHAKEQGYIAVKLNNKVLYITGDNIEDILYVIREMYCVPKNKVEQEEEIDDEMAQLLREFAEEEAKIKKAKGLEITLNSIIESVASHHPSLNLLNIYEYTIYQLMSTYYRIEHMDSSNRVNSAIYSGAISSKEINQEEIYWARELDR